eukprot:m.215578 g.215578  ORF g.215578 m.215578 type:complete len:101 (+) comp39834_c0_seq5:43-345(+)
MLLSEEFVTGKKGDVEKREFLQEVVNMPSHEDNYYPPLTIACNYSSSSDVVLQLLKAGAHVSPATIQKAERNFMPIHAASIHCSGELLNFFFNGAQILTS